MVKLSYFIVRNSRSSADIGSQKFVVVRVMSDRISFRI